MEISREKLLAEYLAGNNITQLLRDSSLMNTEEAIELAYDLQAGSYVQAMENHAVSEFKKVYADEISRVIRGLCRPRFLMEAGVGEATTFSSVLKNFPDSVGYGFDISWSRIAEARGWVRNEDVANTCHLFTGSIFNIPLPDNSVDVVYTSHSIEPNGGREREAVKELYRVAKSYVVLLEPAWDFASAEGRSRMESPGYCVNLFPVIEGLGLRVLQHSQFPFSINPLNPTGLTIIAKESDAADEPFFCCPATGCVLRKVDGAYYSSEHLAAYPIIDGIPCLRVENSVVASAFSRRGSEG